MARVFNEKELDLIKLTVVPSNKVWDIKKKRKGKPTLSTKYDYFGRVDKGTSAFVTSTNLIGENHKIVIDTYKLPKNIKNDIVKLLKNQNRSVGRCDFEVLDWENMSARNDTCNYILKYITKSNSKIYYSRNIPTFITVVMKKADVVCEMLNTLVKKVILKDTFEVYDLEGEYCSRGNGG